MILEFKINGPFCVAKHGENAREYAVLNIENVNIYKENNLFFIIKSLCYTEFTNDRMGG